MKRWINRLAAVAVLAAASLSLAACSSENKEDGTSGQESSDYAKRIVGQWQITKYYNHIIDEWTSYDDGNSYVDRILFRADGTGKCNWFGDIEAFTYTFSGAKIILNFQTDWLNANFYYEFTSISGDQFVWKDVEVGGKECGDIAFYKRID